MSRISRHESDLPRRSLWQRIKDVALLDLGALSDSRLKTTLEELEDTLIGADFGVPVTVRLVDMVSRRAAKGELKTEVALRDALRAAVEEALRAGRSDPSFVRAMDRPAVVLIVGVN